MYADIIKKQYEAGKLDINDFMRRIDRLSHAIDGCALDNERAQYVMDDLDFIATLDAENASMYKDVISSIAYTHGVNRETFMLMEMDREGVFSAIIGAIKALIDFTIDLIKTIFGIGSSSGGGGSHTSKVEEIVKMKKFSDLTDKEKRKVSKVGLYYLTLLIFDKVENGMLSKSKIYDNAKPFINEVEKLVDGIFDTNFNITNNGRIIIDYRIDIDINKFTYKQRVKTFTPELSKTGKVISLTHTTATIEDKLEPLTLDEEFYKSLPRLVKDNKIDEHLKMRGYFIRKLGEARKLVDKVDKYDITGDEIYDYHKKIYAAYGKSPLDRSRKRYNKRATDAKKIMVKNVQAYAFSLADFVSSIADEATMLQDFESLKE